MFVVRELGLVRLVLVETVPARPVDVLVPSPGDVLVQSREQGGADQSVEAVPMRCDQHPHRVVSTTPPSGRRSAEASAACRAETSGWNRREWLSFGVRAGNSGRPSPNAVAHREERR